MLFIAMPLVFDAEWVPRKLFPMLWTLTVVAMGLLLLDRSFDRRQLWGIRAAGRRLPQIMAVWLALAPTVALLSWLVLPEDRFLGFVRHKPELWAVIMFAYPVFSVYPQTVVYRVFLMHRYEPLLGRGPMMLLASAAAFGFVHVIFRNGVAPIATFVVGLMFANTYRRTRSGLASAAEHALWGDLAFTLGLGLYFYMEAVR